MNEALDGLFTKLGYDRKKIWIISVAFWVLYVGAMVLAVYLSAWNMKSTLLAGIYIYLLFVALPLLFSPVLWGIVGTFLSLVGQFGGEKGPSIKDATTALNEYGKPLLNKVAYALLVAIPVWFMAMVLLNTKGMELVYIFVIPFLPATIYLCLKRWPDGETFTAVVRTVMLVIVLGTLAWGIFNTVNRGVTDPEVQLMQEYLDGEQVNRNANIEQQTKKLIKKLKNKETLTKQEQELQQLLLKKMEGGASGVQGAAGKVRQTIEQAKPSDLDWWKKNWYWPTGFIALLVLVAMMARRKPTTASSTATTKQSIGFWDGLGYVMTVAAILYFPLYYWWYAGPGWYEVASFNVTTLQARKASLLRELPRNEKFRFVVPNEERGALRARIEDVATGRSSDGDLAAGMLINGKDRSESFEMSNQNFWLSWKDVPNGEGKRVVDQVVIPVKILVAHKSSTMNWLAELLAF